MANNEQNKGQNQKDQQQKSPEEVAQLKNLIADKAKELKVLYVARKVKKPMQDKKYFKLVSALFDDFDENIEEFIKTYDLKNTVPRAAEKKANKHAVSAVLGEQSD